MVLWRKKHFKCKRLTCRSRLDRRAFPLWRSIFRWVDSHRRCTERSPRATDGRRQSEGNDQLSEDDIRHTTPTALLRSLRFSALLLADQAHQPIVCVSIESKDDWWALKKSPKLYTFKTLFWYYWTTLPIRNSNPRRIDDVLDRGYHTRW